MTKKIEVLCDECEKVFEVKKIKSKMVGVYEGERIKFTYFDCSSCKTKFFTGLNEKVFNKLMVIHRRNAKKMLTLKNNNADIEEIEALQKENQQLNKLAVDRTELLKNLFQDWQ